MKSRDNEGTLEYSLNDDVILLPRPESFRVSLSSAN